jgi:hypothetical protein
LVQAVVVFAGLFGTLMGLWFVLAAQPKKAFMMACQQQAENKPMNAKSSTKNT